MARAARAAWGRAPQYAAPRAGPNRGLSVTLLGRLDTRPPFISSPSHAAPNSTWGVCSGFQLPLRTLQLYHMYCTATATATASSGGTCTSRDSMA